MARCQYNFNSGILASGNSGMAPKPSKSLHVGWHRTRPICHWPWNVKSTIVATCNFAASPCLHYTISTQDHLRPCLLANGPNKNQKSRASPTQTRIALGKLVDTNTFAALPFRSYTISTWDNSLTKQYTTYSKQISGKMLSVEYSGAEQLSGIIQL